jgi:2,3-dihydroxyphenylpropionate 1,2-dioxygenase
MIVGAVCLSHTPLLDKARAEPEVEQQFDAAIARAAARVEAWAPDLTVVFFPDHFNGFFYDLMPPYCIGARASSIGDFGTAPGTLLVPEDLAVSCAKACLDAGVDAALSYRMRVDHGAVQPIELLSRGYRLTNILPIFVNCAAPPLPRLARIRALGQAVGRWAEALDRKVLMVASGGLSHDPPLPSMATAKPEDQGALIDNRGLDHAGRMARQDRVFNARFAYVAGTSPLLPLDPAWDRQFLDSMVAGALDIGDDWVDAEISATAGRGGHEVRNWIAALAALGPYQAEVEFYQPIREWLTGTGILTAEPRRG